MQTITLKYPATCSDCNAHLPAGTRAKYYNSRHIYGLECHPKPDQPVSAGMRYLKASRQRQEHAQRLEDAGAPLGAIYSALDPDGFYSPEGVRLGGVRCNHEDYPCCGCA